MTTTLAPATPLAHLLATYGEQIVSYLRGEEIFKTVPSEPWTVTFECRVCGKQIKARSERRTNFARASHAAMHARKGEVYQSYPGTSSTYLLPSEASCAAEQARRTSVAEAAPLAEAVKAQIKPIVAQRRLAANALSAAERILAKAFREHGVRVFEEPHASAARWHAAEIQRQYQEMQREIARIDAILDAQPESVKELIRMGDL